MSTYTDTQMYEQVRNAIYSIVTKGKSYTIGDRTYTRHDLKDLQELETYYKKRADAAGGRTTNYAAFQRPQ